MNINIVGLGYVGTVSAACLAARGHQVWGVDINPEKVRMIAEGRSPIVEPGLDDRLRQARQSGRLQVTCDLQEALRESDVCFVCVATPSRPSGQIDPAHLFRVCHQIAEALSKLGKRQIVVIRSSVLPATFDQCRDIFASLPAGQVELCANPEFLREATAIRDFEEPSFTVLGTDTEEVAQQLQALYEGLPGAFFRLPPREALMVKYASNAYHALKVAFANEIAAVCQESDADAAAVMKVFCADNKLNVSARYLMPGFAFGGSCLPKDVRAILYAGNQYDLELPLMRAILQSNEQVIARAFQKIRATKARRIGLIGLSFKSATDDLRESPFVELAERLLGKGYELSIFDPNVAVARLTGANKEYIDRVIPHLSRLLASSLDELANLDLLLVGHRFAGVDVLLERTSAAIIDLSAYDAHSRSAENAQKWALTNATY
jgi:GDP-mannose 6-dehydrogenase